MSVAQLEPLLPLADGVITLDAHDDADVEAYVTRPPDGHDLFWPVAAEADAVRRWLDAGSRAQPSLIIAIRVDGVLVGGIEVRVLTSRIGSLDFWIFPDKRRLGYASRAVTLATSALCAACGVEVVQLRVREANRPSRALAERLGFREVERQGDEIIFHG